MCAVSAAQEFLRNMSKPQQLQQQVGTVLLSVDDIQGVCVCACVHACMRACV
jgi:hypothetical protein